MLNVTEQMIGGVCLHRPVPQIVEMKFEAKYTINQLYYVTRVKVFNFQKQK